MSLLQWFGNTGRAIRRAVAVGEKSATISTSAILGAQRALGPWGDAIYGFIPREVNPYFYESLREAIGPIDGGIGRLVTMDGIIRVRGANDKIVNLIETEFMANIVVNDQENGFQAFYASQSNELYEQGFAVGEHVMDEAGKELIGLRVADSKGIYYRRDEKTGALETWYRPPAPKRCGRRDGSDQIEAVLRNRTQQSGAWLIGQGYVQLDTLRVIYAAFNPEAANPYGVSVLRSLEFVSQILLKIQNATGHVWDRFGDPPLQLTYKTNNAKLGKPDLDKRRDALGMELAKVLDAKRLGNSADFVQAIGKDDDISIKAIATDGTVIEIEMPARHMMEQILAKFGLPAWMLGMQWSTAERMADQQSEIVLQESRTRFARRKPGMTRTVATWLRGRGITWKPGDWELYQELPRLQDMLKESQANFLDAQTALMLNGQQPTVPKAPGAGPASGLEPNKSNIVAARMKSDGSMEFDLPMHAHKSADAPSEPWAEDDAALPKIEARAVAGLTALWSDLRDSVLRVLKLPSAKAATGKAPDMTAWTFDPVNVLNEIADAESVFIDAAGAVDGPLLQESFRAWVRGLENAASDMDASAAIEETRSQWSSQLAQRGLDLVKTATARALRDDILTELQSGAYAGLNPTEVARRLAAQFDLHNYDWERLARSEIAYAQSLGKQAQYATMDVQQYDWITGGAGVCPICIGYESGGPYPLGNGPMPMRDSHPNCRCSILAHDES